MKTPVLIVGAGPVGLSLAGELGWRGIPCVVVDHGDGSVFQPKMDMIGVRTMEFCRRWGIVQRVEQAGYNRDYVQDCAWVSALHGGYEFGRERFPSCKEELCPPQSPQKRERCPQHLFDPVLMQFARDFPHVTIRYKTEFTGFTQHENGVRASIVDLASGHADVVACDFLVGCDGGASSVRSGLGIGLAGNPALTYTTNALIRCSGLEKLHDKEPAYRFIFIDEAGMWCTLVAINGRDWWRMSIVGDETRRALSEDQVRNAFIRAVGRQIDFELLSVMPWVRRQLVAEHYGEGRVFIAGDACHLTSPTGGFGMNTGIQDAVDLGWKLEATIRGWGGSGLLPSYSMERRPVALRNVAEATGNLKRMTSAHDPAALRLIFDSGAAGAAARKQFGDAYTQIMKREWHTLGIHLGYRYEGSPIVVADGTVEPEDNVSEYVQTARPGHRAPHLWLEDGKSTLDYFGRGFVLMRFDKDLAVDTMVNAAANCGLPLAVVDIAHAGARSLYECRLILVRPDGHVAWRGDTQPENAAHALDTVRGARAVRD